MESLDRCVRKKRELQGEGERRPPNNLQALGVLLKFRKLFRSTHTKKLRRVHHGRTVCILERKGKGQCGLTLYQ